MQIHKQKERPISNSNFMMAISVEKNGWEKSMRLLLKKKEINKR